MTKFIDADLLSVIQKRHGEIFAQALMDQLNCKPSDDPQCLEVLQMSEITHRFRTHIREMKAEYRRLEALERIMMVEKHYIQQETGVLRKQIGETYSLYKTAHGDFIYMFDCYMQKTGKKLEDVKQIREEISSKGRFRASMQKKAAATAINSVAENDVAEAAA